MIKNLGFQFVSYAQNASPEKIYQNNFETINVKDQSTDFEKVSNLIKQVEDLTEAWRAKSSDLSGIEIPKKFLHEYHAAYFSRAFLQLSLETM